ncbi:hypothetical protein [uncultured Sulfitobacter sp.]|uniref:hypothetical protein n=1 Tax=uncultured Sulfitobacter sp. TaxID=191468 RepID=UPI0026237002|nr:hypothetical protein [uncultured Sulfitobacter sp.]
MRRAFAFGAWNTSPCLTSTAIQSLFAGVRGGFKRLTHHFRLCFGTGDPHEFLGKIIDFIDALLLQNAAVQGQNHSDHHAQQDADQRKGYCLPDHLRSGAVLKPRRFHGQLRDRLTLKPVQVIAFIGHSRQRPLRRRIDVFF